RQRLRAEDDRYDPSAAEPGLDPALQQLAQQCRVPVQPGAALMALAAGAQFEAARDPGGDGRIEGAGEHPATRVPVDIAGDFAPRDQGPADPAQRLAERDHEIIDLIENTLLLGNASPAGAAEQEGVRLIDEHL